MTHLTFRSPLSGGLFWGITGGVVLLLVRFMPVPTYVSEAALLTSFTAIMFFAYRTFRPAGRDRIFMNTFLMALLTFMLQPLVVHAGLYLVFYDERHPELIEPFFIALGTGTILCFFLTILSTRIRLKRESSPGV